MTAIYRSTLALSLTAAGVFAAAQIPDVKIKADIRLHYRSEAGESSLRWYDPLGRYSVVSMEFMLEPGFRAFVSERLQKIRDNADSEQLDEYYVEDPGLWRVGKQYLPFGRQKIVRDAGRGARGDTNLIFENLPIAGAICDNGAGRTRGVIGRIGGRLGLSVAYGDHFAAQSTSLVQVRRPEDANGFGRGYQLVVGADFYRHIGDVLVEGEFAAFRRGHTATDGDMEVSDLSLSYSPLPAASFSLGWARDWRTRTSVFRAEAKLEVYKHVFIEPLVRFKDSAFYDAGVSIHVKM